ncbi:response regulator [candidate division KSB1 bacterium]
MTKKIKRILIVDDEIEFGKSIQRQLKRSGFFSECAVNGRHAFYKIQDSILKNQPFDLVITDLIMPHMDGSALVGRLLMEYPSISIVVMSGYSELGEIKKILRPELDSFCRKPFTPKQIVELIASIEQKRMRFSKEAN